MIQKIPLALRIKKEAHRRIAEAQDLILKEVYEIFNTAVLHGGTAIWRCYSGKRFSEDLDFYIPKNLEKINQLFENLEKRGFKILKKRVLDNSIYSEFEFNRINVRFEATFQNIKGSLMDYENIDGTFTSIYSLSPEDFIKEKINNYINRHKIRDLYDVFFLSKSISDPKKIVNHIKRLIDEYKDPVDEQNLKTIILEGIVPKSREMFDYLKQKWLKKNI